MQPAEIAPGPCHFERAFGEHREMLQPLFDWWRDAGHPGDYEKFVVHPMVSGLFRLTEMKLGRRLNEQEIRTMNHHARIQFALAELFRTGPIVYRPTRRVLEALEATKPKYMVTPPIDAEPFYVHLAGLTDIEVTAKLESEIDLAGKLDWEHAYNPDTDLAGFRLEGVYLIPARNFGGGKLLATDRIICIGAYKPSRRRHKHEHDDYAESANLIPDADWEESLDVLRTEWKSDKSVSHLIDDGTRAVVAERTAKFASYAVTLWQVLHHAPESLKVVKRRADRPSALNPKKRAKILRRTTAHRFIELDLSDEVIKKVTRSAEPSNDAHSGRNAPHLHRVRSHWKWQPYGPGRESRRWLHVGAYWRGELPKRTDTVVKEAR